jgi:hypothetical protein
MRTCNEFYGRDFSTDGESLGALFNECIEISLSFFLLSIRLSLLFSYMMLYLTLVSPLISYCIGDIPSVADYS